MSTVTVVVPTYNRGEALGPVLDRLLASDCQELGEVEIVVVDDGSSAPAAPVVMSRQAPPGFSLKSIRQENAGPAAARNTGFTIGHGDIVIFIDDDILVSPELIRLHVQAHQLSHGAVIFGVCVPPPDARNHVSRLLESLYRSRPDSLTFERVSIIASGQLSVERKSFPDGVYASELRTPAAEEFELSARLRERGIPAFNATEIRAVHDQQLEISDICDQQHKHGMGCAEAICKLPSTLVLQELGNIAMANGPVLPHDPLATKCKKIAKTLIAIPPARQTLVFLSELAGRVIPSYRMNAKILRLVIGVFFFAGYREGLRHFGPSAYDASERSVTPAGRL